MTCTHHCAWLLCSFRTSVCVVLAFVVKYSLYYSQYSDIYVLTRMQVMYSSSHWKKKKIVLSSNDAYLFGSVTTFGSTKRGCICPATQVLHKTIKLITIYDAQIAHNNNITRAR